MTYKPKVLTRFPRRIAQVAQLVEQRTENPRVGGSIPPLGTTHLVYITDRSAFYVLTGQVTYNQSPHSRIRSGI